MVTATKNSIDISLNNLSSKSTSELYKVGKSKTTSKSETSKSEDFKDVLSSKANSKDADTQKVDEVNKLKEKLKELDEDNKSDSKDKVNDILTELLNLLAKLGIKEEDLKSNGETSSNSNLSGVMEKLMGLLKTDSVKNGLDTDSLKFMEKLLSNLNANLADDNTEATKDIKSGIKNLMSEVSNMLDNKQSQSGKVLTLEDMLNKNYSQDNKESSNESQSNKNATSKATKEDKFLNSLLNDDKDSSANKINLFASRTQIVQNQGVDTVRGLTINKATFADDLIKDVKFMSNNGLKELTVKINPGNLGEITIKLIEEDGVLKANLKANSKETTALLSQNLADIKKQLGEQNIKIDDVNIELYQDDTTFFNNEGFNSQFAQEQQRDNSGSNNDTIEKVTDDNLKENMQDIYNENINFLA